MSRLNHNIYEREDGTLWFRKTVAKKPVRCSLETRDIKIARQRRDKILNEIQAGKWGEQRPKTFNEAVERWVCDHIPTLKPKSQDRYKVSIVHLLDVFDGVVLEHISSAKLYEFEQRRRGDGVSTSTIRRDLACLSSLISSAEEWEWADRNPVKAYLRGRAKKGLIEGQPRVRYLRKWEEERILKAASPKAAQAIAFAIDTGLRREEQFSLLKSDIDQDQWAILIRPEVAKTTRARRVPLQERARILVQAILEEDTSGPFLFTTYLGDRYTPTSSFMWEALQKASHRAGVADHVEWHDLRRTCGCRLLNDLGYEMIEVSRWLGHSSVKVTERCYAFLQEEKLHDKLRDHEAQTSALSLQKSFGGTQIPIHPGSFRPW